VREWRFISHGEHVHIFYRDDSVVLRNGCQKTQYEREKKTKGLTVHGQGICIAI
jgi:hypothetical protein